MTFIWCIIKTFLCFESDFPKSGKITVNHLPKKPSNICEKSVLYTSAKTPKKMKTTS